MTKNIPTPTNPAQLDKVLFEFQTRLKDNLSWLDYACGRVIEHEHNNNGKILPKIYIGDDRYVEVMPDASLGNYCFFDVGEKRQVLKHMPGRGMLVKCTFGLVIWFNLSKIYPMAVERKTEDLQQEIVDVLVRKTSLSCAGFLITGITDNAKQVFGKYAGKNPESKYMMHPYGAFRFDGELIYNTAAV